MEENQKSKSTKPDKVSTKADKSSTKAGKARSANTYFRKTARFNGKRLEAYGKTEREANLKLAEKIAAAKRGEELISSGMSVDAWFHQWLDTYKAPKGLTRKSLLMYTEKYKIYIKPYIGHMKLKDISPVHLQKILNQQSGMSESHAKKVRMVLRELFRRARQSRLILNDPSELLELPAVTQKSRRSLTDYEREILLKVCQTHRNGLWILTLLYTGMRPGESATLKWDDVDFQNREIHIRTSRESGTKLIKKPKTAAGVRDIPISSRLLPALQDAFASRNSSKKRRYQSQFVFPGYAGKIADDTNMRRWWLSFRNRMDIAMGAKVYRNKIVESVIAPDLTLYCLRHTFATDLQRAGVPINVAKELMGHSSISVTANVYTHRDTRTLHANMDLFDQNSSANASDAPPSDTNGTAHN